MKLYIILASGGHISKYALALEISGESSFDALKNQLATALDCPPERIRIFDTTGILVSNYSMSMVRGGVFDGAYLAAAILHPNFANPEESSVVQPLAEVVPSPSGSPTPGPVSTPQALATPSAAPATPAAGLPSIISPSSLTTPPQVLMSLEEKVAALRALSTSTAAIAGPASSTGVSPASSEIAFLVPGSSPPAVSTSPSGGAAIPSLAGAVALPGQQSCSPAPSIPVPDEGCNSVTREYTSPSRGMAMMPEPSAIHWDAPASLGGMEPGGSPIPIPAPEIDLQPPPPQGRPAMDRGFLAALEGPLNSLQEMGFDREQCQRALIAALGDVERAVEFLTTVVPTPVPAGVSLAGNSAPAGPALDLSALGPMAHELVLRLGRHPSYQPGEIAAALVSCSEFCECEPKERMSAAAVALANAEVIAPLMAILRAHAALQPVARQACRLVSNLAVDDNLVALTSAGIIPLVVDCLQRHLADGPVCDMACAALWNLAFSFDNRARIAAAGAVPLLVQALQTHNESMDLLRRICGSLANIAAHRLFAPRPDRSVVLSLL
ncbi:hypothetical protein PAPYR_6533 [Paratrimastix pyriformis]|uniref:UBA domain-containing protein n=1 Tax=Paratrimastix pyriformis TaxID=342808 RepID=A0ABQ8UF44_9EUKA|nr:hypothetical protein PAPYR_6533 [Paratrimastix pyriformis]